MLKLSFAGGPNRRRRKFERGAAFFDGAAASAARCNFPTGVYTKPFGPGKLPPLLLLLRSRKESAYATMHGFRLGTNIRYPSRARNPRSICPAELTDNPDALQLFERFLRRLTRESQRHGPFLIITVCNTRCGSSCHPTAFSSVPPTTHCLGVNPRAVDKSPSPRRHSPTSPFFVYILFCPIIAEITRRGLR